MQRNYFWQFREIFLFEEGAFELGLNCDVLDIEIMIFPLILFLRARHIDEAF